MSHRKMFLLALALAAFASLVSSAEAAIFRVGGTRSITDDTIQDDLYAVGETLSIQSSVSGDVVTAARSVVVEGETAADIWAAGAIVNIFGPVGDDVRALGAQVIINDRVADDVLVVAGSLHVLPEAVIEGSLYVAGGEVIIDGTVRGSVRALVNDLSVNGEIDGGVTADVGGMLTVGGDADIGANLTYSSVNPGMVADGAVRGAVVFNQVEEGREQTEQFAGAFFAVLLGAFVLIKTIALLVASILAVVLFKRFAGEFIEGVTERFGAELVRGLVVFIVVPVVALILLVSVVGAFISAVGFLLYALLVVVASIFSGVLAGAILAKVFVKRYAVDWKWAALGVIALAFVRFIPFAGALIVLIFFLASLGYLWNILYQRFWIGR